MEAILSCVQGTCIDVKQIDVQGCGFAAVLRAVAARAQTCFHVASPADLFDVLKNSARLSVDGKCSFVHLLQRLRDGPAPHLDPSLPSTQAIPKPPEKIAWVKRFALGIPQA